jgi:GalNAc-alpha-(1->4)-GalNAc-alpha-(1->3)-diNAcBac-PP-undecaprenol alpha-1,4-N-acetyl-D-galactosaminyltransferase
MTKILILANSKQPGGAEKSAIKLAKSLSEEYQVTFGTLFQGRGDFYSSPNVSEVYFFKCANTLRKLGPGNHPSLPNLSGEKTVNRTSKISGFLPLFIRKFAVYSVMPFDLFFMRRKIRKENFDLVVSFGAGVGCIAYLSLIFTKIPQITSERISPDKKVYRPSFLTRILRPWIYRHGVICSVQSQEFRNTVKSIWGIDSFITPNHFDIPEFTYSTKSNSLPCIAVGRPAYQKGYDLLISAWKILESRIKNELWIVADDSDHYLDSLIKSCGVTNVRIVPLTNNLFELYDKCSLFLSTSRFEGYPNAIAEAIIYGIPVLSTSSSGVVSDWFELGICQEIKASEPIGIAMEIEKTLRNQKQLIKTSRKAIEQRSNFSWKNAAPFWDKIIHFALKSHSDTNM